MRIHTNLNGEVPYQVEKALQSAKDNGKVGQSVGFAVFKPHGSRTHKKAYEVQLGTEVNDDLTPGTVDQFGKEMRVRRNRNSSGGYGPFAATWHEWGWFLSELFDADPSLMTTYYRDRLDFDRKTEYAFKTTRHFTYSPSHP